MRHLQRHISAITETYKGELPLSHFLKRYFKRYPILGSRDRRLLSASAYSWYRVAKGLADSTIADTLITDWLLANKLSTVPLTDLLSDLPVGSFDAARLFPFDLPLSEGITKTEWTTSMLTRPDLFIRVRKDKERITRLLDDSQIPYTFITDTCLALPNGAKIDALLPEDAYVVQDASSQHTGTYFAPVKDQRWYDCCSGAGGKSLLLKDLEPTVTLTVSDRRESILHNLRERFRLYRHAGPEAIVTDVADPAALSAKLGDRLFDNIICDAPCSGSGTWARTPEQLHFFDPGSAREYSALQKRIAVNAARHLAKGGKFFYITCSVFREENEEVAAYIQEQTGMRLTASRLINGIAFRADSMYIAVFEK